MPLWAGIDEAGYGPPLGPLVVAGAAFTVRQVPREGMLWDLLKDAVTRQARGSDGRIVVNDSKQVYSPGVGLRRLEEGVLTFLRAGAGVSPARAGDLFAALGCEQDPAPWFERAADFRLPLATNESALESMAAVLRETLDRRAVKMVALRAALVSPSEFNRIVALTRNKSLLLFQKCGLILQDMWPWAQGPHSHVLVDKHGGRTRYRKLLLDVFPDCRCDILREDAERSVYYVADVAARTSSGGECRSLLVSFQEGADARALPTALGSMVAKYVREIHMLAFNAYWQERLSGLRPTSGYHTDARRFMRDIAPALRAEGVDASALVRLR